MNPYFYSLDMILAGEDVPKRHTYKNFVLVPVGHESCEGCVGADDFDLCNSLPSCFDPFDGVWRPA